MSVQVQRTKTHLRTSPLRKRVVIHWANGNRVIPGAAGFHEMEILEYEGKVVCHLVDFGSLYLTVAASDNVWEHRRLLSLNMMSKRARMEAECWTYEGSRFPYHYFKRIVPGNSGWHSCHQATSGGVRRDKRRFTGISCQT